MSDPHEQPGHADHGHDDHGHDAWFRHGADEALPQQEHAAHVNTTAIGLTLLSIVFGVLLTIVLLSMYFVQYANTRKAEMNEGTGSAAPYLTYRQQSDTMLGTTGWVDRSAGTVNVAIDDAMDAVVSDYAAWGDNARAEWVGPSKPASSSTIAIPHGTPSSDEQEHAHSDG